MQIPSEWLAHFCSLKIWAQLFVCISVRRCVCMCVLCFCSTSAQQWPPLLPALLVRSTVSRSSFRPCTPSWPVFCAPLLLALFAIALSLCLPLDLCADPPVLPSCLRALALRRSSALSASPSRSLLNMCLGIVFVFFFKLVSSVYCAHSIQWALQKQYYETLILCINIFNEFMLVIIYCQPFHNTVASINKVYSYICTYIHYYCIS